MLSAHPTEERRENNVEPKTMTSMEVLKREAQALIDINKRLDKQSADLAVLEQIRRNAETIFTILKTLDWTV